MPVNKNIGNLEKAAAFTIANIDQYGRVWSDVYYEDQVMKDGRETMSGALAAYTFQLLAQMENMLNREDRSNYYTGISKKIIVPTITGFEFLEIANIIRCESDINYTTIYLRDRQKLVVAKTLKEFEELLTDHSFFRIHNSHLINLAFIKRYNKGKGGSVILHDGSEIEVSHRRKDAFLKILSGL